ncbi:TK/FER protein kinase [Aphelenchoides avenae]|nr:TK/FER protein kinase [Aphelenchus avenae]
MGSIQEDSSVSGAEHHSQPSTPSFVASLEREPWYHGKAAKRYASALLRNHGDFLVRLGQSRADNQFKPVLSVKWNERDYHFLIRESDGLFSVEGRFFDSITGLVAFYAQRKCSLTRKSGAKLLRAVDKKAAAPPSGRNSAGKQKLTSSSAEPSQSWASSAAENLTELMPLLLKLALICVVIVVLHFCRALETHELKKQKAVPEGFKRTLEDKKADGGEPKQKESRE